MIDIIVYTKNDSEPRRLNLLLSVILQDMFYILNETINILILQ